MSTKIYNGYKISSEPLYLHQIQALMEPVRDILSSTAQDAIAKETISMAFGLMDEEVARSMGYEVGKEEGENTRWQNSSKLSIAHSSLRDQIEEDAVKQRPNRFDPEVSLCVFTSQEGTYALLYTEGKKLKKVFEDVLGAQEFNYWNNTDHDEDVPYDLWKKRGQMWDEFLGNSTPAERGATLTLVSRNLIYYPHPILVYPKEGESEKDIPEDWIPDFDRRMRQLAMSMPQAQLPPDLLEEQKKSNSFSIISRHIRQLEKGEIPQFNELLEELKRVMPRTYTMGQLRLSAEELGETFGSKPPRSPKP